MLPADCDKLMSAPAAFLSGGGEMGALMRACDWSATPLGEPAGWPTALKTTLRLLLTSNHPMFIWWGPELIQFYNDAYRATLDTRRHPAALGQRGRACWEEAWPIIGPQIEQVMRGGGATWHEDHLVPLVRDGVLSDAWWTYGYSPIEDDSGVRGVLAICKDVTSEHQTRAALAAAKMRSDVALAVSEHQLERQLGDWQQLHAMSERLLEERTLSGQFDIVLRAVTQLHGCHRGVVSLYDAGAGGLVTQASQGLDEAGLAALRCVPVGAGACGTAFRDKRRIVVADTATDPLYAEYRGFALEQGIKALYSTPFFANDGSALGVISMYFSDQRVPDEREMQLTDICARHLAPIVERERTQAQLHREQQRSHHILQTLQDGFVLMDRDYRILQINAAGVAMDGRSAARIVGRTHWEVWPGSERQAAGELYRRVMRERVAADMPVSYECDGQTRWFSVHAYPYEDGLAVLYRDITRQRETERELQELGRESEQRRRLYETFLSNTPDLAYVFDPEHRFTYANDVLLKLLNRSWEEAIGKTFLELGYEAWHAEMHDREIEQVKASRAPIKGVVPFDGGLGRRMYEYIFVPVMGPDGEVEAVAGTTRDITERLLSEEAIRQSEERFRSLIVATTQMVWHCGPDGAIEADSPTWRAYTGQTYDEWKGFGWLDAVHPDDRAASLAHWRACVARRIPYESEQRLRTAGGEYRWTVGRAVPIFGEDGAIREWVGTTTDIHDRRQTELDRQRFVTLAERSEDFIGMAGLDLRPFFLNRAAVRLVGAETLEEALATPVQGFFFPEDRDFITREFLPRVAREGHSETEVRMRHFRTGAAIWMIYTVYVIRDQQGQPEGYATVSRNITERKLAEERLRQATVDLQDANNRKTRFLATLAHELRNPLAPLRTGLDLMQLPGSSPQTLTRARTMMDRQLRQMVHLIDDLMDIARIDSGKIELKRERVALRQVITIAVEGVMPMMEAAGHRLDVEVPEEALCLDADPTRLAQVLTNLLTNACKYTPPGGVVTLSARTGGAGSAVVAVRDTGMGIPPDALESVFDMFSQVSQNIGRAQGGLGIGLALVRSLVQMHGGSIHAESAGMGQGSCFTLRLPLAPASLPAGGNGPDGRGAMLAGPAAGMPILVADDNVDAATMLAAVLEARGYRVTLAHDGRAALALAQEARFELVILDIGMPGLSGYELARALRRLPHLDGALLAAHTGWGAEHDRSEATAAGFDAHLTKPAGLEEIDALLGRLAAAG
ncbi:PAS domain-containing protein [Massilia sp. LjRoot122]|uniref:PAS domain-containing protein n=1 Tax=Massilia sp. LjRoot122 TaxID=3342257 RepID=UPI003ECF9C52